MELRKLGRTALPLSVLGYGCGAVGGLMVKGEAAEQERAIARALELGITYFDTAALYGNGESERNLGRVLNTLKPRGIYVGTKVNVAATDRKRIGAAIIEACDASLSRLDRESVDLFQLHNTISSGGGERMLPPEVVLEEVVPAFDQLRLHGKARFCGFTAVGDTAALHKLIDARVFDQPERRRRGAGRLSGAGLRPAARAHARRQHGRDQHPRARRRRAQRQRRAPSLRQPAARSDRLRRHLQGRPRARPAP